MTNINVFAAYLNTRMATEDLLWAHVIETREHRISDVWFNNAVNRLTDAAEALGYNLVKRDDVKTAEAA